MCQYWLLYTLNYTKNSATRHARIYHNEYVYFYFCTFIFYVEAATVTLNSLAIEYTAEMYDNILPPKVIIATWLGKWMHTVWIWHAKCYCLKRAASPRKELLSSATRGEEAFISTAWVSGSLAMKDTILYLSLRDTCAGAEGRRREIDQLSELTHSS